MNKITKKVPKKHALWIRGLLSQLSDEQIKTAFRAAGFFEDEVQGFAEMLRARISEINIKAAH
jgi:hypothetical protein